MISIGGQRLRMAAAISMPLLWIGVEKGPR
jgi:hypothetical protein